MIACLSLSGVYAQKSKVVATYNYLRNNEYKKAKVAIDKATKNPKTSNNAKTWWYNGRTYHSLNDMCMYQNDNEYCELAPDAANIALDSYIKALLLNMKDEKWHSLDIINNETDAKVFFKLLQDKKNIKDYEITGDILVSRFPALANVFVNKGVKELNDEKGGTDKMAVESFETSLFLSGLMKIDTPIYYYTAIAAERAKMYDKAIDYFKKVIDFGYGKNDTVKISMYDGLASCYESNGDTALFIETLKKGIEKYPAVSNSLVPKLINYYLINDMSTEALEYLDIAIERTPDNFTYLFAQGSLYDKLKQYDKAEESYKKALEIKPDYFDANYNLGAIYFNKAVELFNSLSDIPIDKQKLYDKTLEDAKAQLRVAQPYLEKALEINDKDIDTITSLNELYVRLNMYDKSKEMKAKLDELK